jgi:hypothetical protein
MSAQCVNDLPGCPRYFPGRVKIVDAQQPAAAMGAGIKIACQCCDQ